jgi:hypothetical protein
MITARRAFMEEIAGMKPGFLESMQLDMIGSRPIPKVSQGPMVRFLQRTIMIESPFAEDTRAIGGDMYAAAARVRRSSPSQPSLFD